MKRNISRTRYYGEIDLQELINIFISRKRFIIFVTFSFILLTAIISFYLLLPVYESQTSLLVLYGDTKRDTTGYEAGDLKSIITNISKLPDLTINTYVQQIKDPVLLSQVIAKLDLTKQGYTIEKLRDKIEVQAIKDTNIIEIKVRDTNPDLAVNIAKNISNLLLASISRSTEEKMNKVVTFLSEQVDSISTELEAERARLATLQGLSNRVSQAQDVSRKVAELEKMQSLLLEKIIEAEIAKSVNLGDKSFQIISPTILLEKPVKPNKALNIGLAGLAGLLASFAVVVVQNSTNKKIKTKEDVEKYLQYPILGVIPKFKNKRGKDKLPISCSWPKSVEAEAFRILRTNLQFISSAKAIKSLVMTSTASGEGKSTMVANIGIILAKAGENVLIVDSDLRSPVQHKIFSLNNERGLSNILAENLPPWLYINETNIPGVHLLPAGPIPPNPAELLAAEGMNSLIESLTQHFDYVLFDSPPILAVTDAVLLSAKVDGVCIVIKAGITRVDKVKEGFDNLKCAKAQILGVVLNSVERGKSDYYYYDYYGGH